MEQPFAITLQSFLAETADQPNWNPRQITKLNLSIDASGNFVFTFKNNVGQQYVLLVLSLDVRTRSRTEFHAYIDVLTICTPGTEITHDIFDHLIKSLRQKYHRVSHPLQDAHHRIAAILPGWRRERPNTATHRIVTAHLLLMEHNQIIVRAQTHSDLIYILALQPSFPSYGLSMTDCNFLIYALYLLCKGTVLPPKAFLAESLFFRETCPNLKLQVFQNPQCYVISFNAIPDQVDHPLPQPIEDAAAEVLYETCPWFKSSDDSGNEGAALTPSPYPFICVGPQLRTDCDGQIFFAVRRWSPCAIRIFDKHVNTTTFFGKTVKQLLLMDPHPNVVGVLDLFLEPQRAILLEDMRGDTLSLVVEEMHPMEERHFINLAIGIARGIEFLHLWGLVHHELGLFNVIVCEDRPRIACIECGFMNYMSAHVHTHNLFPPDNRELELLSEDGVGDKNRDIVRQSLGAIPGASIEVKHPDGHQIVALQGTASTKSYADRVDVACFGVMMWEMLTGKKLLVNDGTKMTEERLQALAFEQREILLLQVAEDASDAVRDIIHNCWCADPTCRPTMSHIVQLLENLFEASLPKFLSHEDDLLSGLSSGRGNDDHAASRNVTSATLQNSVREVRFIRDQKGNEFDAFANYEMRYPSAAGTRAISEKAKAFLNLRDCYVTMNMLETCAIPESFKISSYYRCPPGINQMRRREAFSVFGEEIMEELDKEFSLPADCSNVEAVFSALTAPYRQVQQQAMQVTVSERTLLRVVLSYRHVHPDVRTQQGWPHRQRIAEDAYRTIAARISRYACALGAETVAVWTDQHFADTHSSDSWGNNCLLPYAVYPVVFFEDGDKNEDRLWICAEHQLALSGEGIISEIDELPGVWRKTKPGAVAGKLLPLPRSLTEGTTCLLPNIERKQTYHASDRDDIIAWTRAVAFLGYSRDIWKVYQTMQMDSIASEVASSVLEQGFSPAWVWHYPLRRWQQGAVLRTSNGSERGVVLDRKGWHGLWDWVQMRKDYTDSSEMFATVRVESYTRATQIESEDASYGFVFLIGLAGQLCRCSVVELQSDGDRMDVQRVCVLSDYLFASLVNSLKEVACIEEKEILEDDDKQGSLLRMRDRSLASDYPSDRVGSPALDAVNEVLVVVKMPTVRQIQEYRFLNGHEIYWD